MIRDYIPLSMFIFVISVFVTSVLFNITNITAFLFISVASFIALVITAIILTILFYKAEQDYNKF